MGSVVAMMKVRHLRDKRRKRSDWTDQPSAPRSTSVKAASSFGECLDEVLEKRVVAAGISWQPRRVKLCRNYFTMYQPGHDRIIDRIPLYEILLIESAMDDDESQIWPEAWLGREKGPTVEKMSVEDWIGGVQHVEARGKLRCFKFTTVEGGYNGGKTYYFRTADHHSLLRWVSLLVSSSRAALSSASIPSTCRA